jgi:uncharacterized protein (TIGR02996 family)
MSLHDAFLRAVIENRDDDAPRLVYADWLEEGGDAERAAFIRLQVEAAGLPEGDGRRSDLEERALYLLVRHLDDWLGPLRTLATNWIFQRGFVERVTVLHEVFLERADELLAAAPVRSVFFRRVRLPLVGRLAAAPQLARLEEVNLWHDHLSERSAELLAASPHLGRLASLNLGSNRVRDRGARALAASPNLGGLRRLDLSDNRVGTAGALALAASPHLPALEVLDLRDNPIEPAGARALRERFGAAVRL